MAHSQGCKSSLEEMPFGSEAWAVGGRHEWKAKEGTGRCYSNVDSKRGALSLKA
jgi:hypothetical protein